jgi:hypothetical protein
MWVVALTASRGATGFPIDEARILLAIEGILYSNHLDGMYTREELERQAAWENTKRTSLSVEVAVAEMMLRR